MCWKLLGHSSPTKAQIRPALHCTHPGSPVKNSRSESSTLSPFVTNLAGKPFDDSVPDEWKRHQLAHTAEENIVYTPILARASSSESSTLSRFVTNLAGKPFDNSVPNDWKRHHLAHTAVEKMLYTPVLASASSSESSTLSSFVTHLAGKRFWYDGLLNTAYYTILARAFTSESSTFCHKLSRKTDRQFSMYGKDTNWLTMRIDIRYCVNTYQGTYAQTLMANQ